MSLPTQVSTGELATLLGVTNQTINGLTKAGVLTQIARGRYDLAATVQGFWRFKERSATQRARIGSPYHAARTRKMEADAVIAEMNARQRRCELAEVDDVVGVVGAMVLVVRQRLLAMPARVTPRVHGKERA